MANETQLQEITDLCSDLIKIYQNCPQNPIMIGFKPLVSAVSTLLMGKLLALQLNDEVALEVCIKQEAAVYLLLAPYHKEALANIKKLKNSEK